MALLGGISLASSGQMAPSTSSVALPLLPPLQSGNCGRQGAGSIAFGSVSAPVSLGGRRAGWLGGTPLHAPLVLRARTAANAGELASGSVTCTLTPARKQEQQQQQPQIQSQGAAQSTSQQRASVDKQRRPDLEDCMTDAEKRVTDYVLWLTREGAAAQGTTVPSPSLNASDLDTAYERCGEVCAEYAKTFYLGTKLMTPERQRAIWAIYVWCRRTDELVDGPNASYISPVALDRWEERLEDVFNGRPYDILDAALSDTVANYPVDIQPFRDMIEGMRMDLRKKRYDNFDELYLYCYNVAGTVGVMTTPVMGIAEDRTAPVEDIYKAALALGIANQLTNILRDVGEDARRNRIYVPMEELAAFGLGEEDVMRGVVDDRWRAFMKFQIKRARRYFAEAEFGASQLHAKSRWPVWASLILYRQILDAIELNDYDNFTKRAYVPKVQKMLSLPAAYLQSLQRPAPLPARNL